MRTQSSGEAKKDVTWLELNGGHHFPFIPPFSLHVSSMYSIVFFLDKVSYPKVVYEDVC